MGSEAPENLIKT